MLRYYGVMNYEKNIACIDVYIVDIKCVRL